ncbi:MAG: helix-turn-helix domain-containing protein [Chloroflexi bacterium]|nr:helix-turn-helix domain-containing protein [Chloroflexota bacterium]
MNTTAIATVAGPRPFLSYLLTHGEAELKNIAAHLGRDLTQVQRAAQRLARHGIVTVEGELCTLVSTIRPHVANYTEGAISLQELVASRS